MSILLNSASRASLRKPNSVSSRALKTSAGRMVFLPALTVCSFALGAHFSKPKIHILGRGGDETYAAARWLMKTVVLLLSASTALAWICVLAGSTPFASLVMIDFGKLRSWISPSAPGPSSLS